MRAHFTRDPIDPAELLDDLATSADGATVLFLGHVRDRNEGQEVTGIRYDAYVEMAERTLAEIAADTAARLGTSHLALVHRIGELAVGEVSVAIAVASPHRAEAFDACRFAIEELKRRLPIWKEEHYPDRSARWLPGAAVAEDRG
jgi:molybdopterin synthase catalytic subunit